ncbi:hypothetical protein ABUZ23_001224 [Yersinia enterocolitica]|uniref:hypothetical protein n=1 Tax=Yersinia frederiksenii TaxID=29484 RepID=UPI0025AAABE3|nr:hypothetical protein [Yersinia frederiksenii]MDN0120587.1 hypothetical protein [Yersinia frederiksenii]
MLKQIIIIDESGAKGYAKNTEEYIGDFGVMAGFLLNENDLSRMRYIIEQSFNDLSIDGKLHMASLNKEEKELVISRVRTFMRLYEIKWTYSAIYVNGYHRFNSSSTIGPNKKDLLHSTLFEHLMTKLIINGVKISLSQNKKSFSLTCISDHIENKTIRKFKNDMKIPLKFLRGENLITEIDDQGNEKPLDTLKNIEINIKTENSTLTFISDVISYVTWKHLGNKINENNDIKLQCKSTMENHPFFSSMALMFNDENSFIDDVFKREK